ncbi:MAG: hypothetical protein IPN45_15665 [Actinomycetales bacterium]|nr:hypothetical protein [Actinomycetales bacterium]
MGVPYPVFPLLSRAVMFVQLDCPSPWSAPGRFALCSDLCAAVALGTPVKDSIGRSGALAWVVTVYAVFPSPSPAPQLAYTGVIAMLLLCCYLLALQREKWLVATP